MTTAEYKVGDMVYSETRGLCRIIPPPKNKPRQGDVYIRDWMGLTWWTGWNRISRTPWQSTKRRQLSVFARMMSDRILERDDFYLMEN